MGPTWVLSAPDGPHGGPMNLALTVSKHWQQHQNTLNYKVNKILVQYLAQHSSSNSQMQIWFKESNINFVTQFYQVRI